MATIHAGDMFTGCAECAARYVGILFDGSHRAARDLDAYIIGLASDNQWDAWDVTPDEDGNYPDWAAEEALDFLNGAVVNGYAFTIEDNSLYLVDLSEDGEW